MDLSKQQARDADPKALANINFTRNLERDGNKNMTVFFFYERIKRNCFRFFSRNCKSIIILFFALT